MPLNDNQIVISFCITVFNQEQLVKSCIESIVSYKGYDIEIIVSDDGSDEDIQGLCDSFMDSRIKYYKNVPNLGHDLNIVSSFLKANGKFAFLLTSRCQVISSCIPDIIEFINVHPNCAYITGNALEENGEVRYSYNKEIISQGDEAIHSLFTLYNHPAGSLYSLEKLPIIEVKDFLEKNILNKQSFSAHCIMRMKLAECGDFGFVCKPMWRYIRPHSDDIAVNTTQNKTSVYDPIYLKQRCSYKLQWCKEKINREHWDYIVSNIYKKYLRGCTWEFFFDNSDADLQKHYRYKKRKVSLLDEQKDYINEINRKVVDIFGKDYFNHIKHLINKSIVDNFFCGWEKIFMQKRLKGTKLYGIVGNIYKQIITRRL